MPDKSPIDPRDKEYYEDDTARQKAVDKRGYYTAEDQLHAKYSIPPSKVVGAPLPKAPKASPLSSTMTPVEKKAGK